MRFVVLLSCLVAAGCGDYDYIEIMGMEFTADDLAIMDTEVYEYALEFANENRHGWSQKIPDLQKFSEKWGLTTKITYKDLAGRDSMNGYYWWGTERIDMPINYEVNRATWGTLLIHELIHALGSFEWRHGHKQHARHDVEGIYRKPGEPLEASFLGFVSSELQHKEEFRQPSVYGSPVHGERKVREHVFQEEVQAGDKDQSGGVRE